MKKPASARDSLKNIPNEVESMKARAQLMHAVQEVVHSWQISQIEAAQRLGLTQPRLNDLLRGKSQKFSLDALFDLLPHIGITPSIALNQGAKVLRKRR